MITRKAGERAGEDRAGEDHGAADPALAAALQAGDAAAVLRLLPAARLLVPVVAMPGAPGAPGEAEMAVPHLVNADGARALPAFSSLDALREWRPEARPVPMPGARALAAAQAEGYDGLVLDVAGPHPFTVPLPPKRPTG